MYLICLQLRSGRLAHRRPPDVSAGGLQTGAWRPRRRPRRPPGAVCGRASCRPRRPPDGPPGAPDGLRTGFLSPQTASGQFSWRPRRPPDGPPGVQDGLRTDLPAPSGPSTPMLFCRFYCACMMTFLTKHLSDQLGCR